MEDLVDVLDVRLDRAYSLLPASLMGLDNVTRFYEGFAGQTRLVEVFDELLNMVYRGNELVPEVRRRFAKYGCLELHLFLIFVCHLLQLCVLLTEIIRACAF